MTKDEALKLALDAIEVKDDLYLAQIILRQAIEQPEQDAEKDYKDMRRFQSLYIQTDQELRQLRRALEQPEQEPVAWFVVVKKDGKDRYVQMSEADPEFYVPLYAAPPKQEFVCSTGLCHYKHWVGLTDEEIEQLGDKHLVNTPKYIGSGEYVYFIDGETDFARAIEAKLKEKNIAP